MVAFDTLSYARRLKQAGVPEAMADATRELVIADFATKDDIGVLRSDIGAVKNEIATLKAELASKIELAALEQRLTAAMDTLGLRLVVRLGGLIAVGVAVLAAIIKL